MLCSVATPIICLCVIYNDDSRYIYGALSQIIPELLRGVPHRRYDSSVRTNTWTVTNRGQKMIFKHKYENIIGLI